MRCNEHFTSTNAEAAGNSHSVTARDAAMSRAMCSIGIPCTRMWMATNRYDIAASL
jgi:hypothetical protein